MTVFGLRPLPVVLLCFLLSFCMGRHASADEVDVLVDKILKLSGVSAQIEMLPGALFSSIPGDAFPDGKAREEAEAVLKKAVGKDELYATVRAALKEVFSGEHPAKVAAFYESRVGKKVGRLQAGALSGGLLQSIREGRKSTVSLDENRLNLLKRLIRAENVAESNSRLASSVIRGLLEGSSGQPLYQTEKELEKEIRSDNIRVEETALVAFAQTFRSLDDKELLELAVFADTDSAAWFRNGVNRGLDRAAYAAAKALGKALEKRRNAPQQGK
jgi:hypothetical protein